MARADDVAGERRRGDRAGPRPALDAVREYDQTTAPVGGHLDPVGRIAERSRPADGGRPRVGEWRLRRRYERGGESEEQEEQRNISAHDCRASLQFLAWGCGAVLQARAVLPLSTVAWRVRLVSPMASRRRRYVRVVGTVLLVTAVWAVAFAVGTGITALATPWEELAQGVE